MAEQTNVADFVGGPSWCSRFMRRKSPICGFENNCASEAAGKLGRESYELLSVCFSTKGGTCQTSRSCFQPMSFDAPYSRTVETTGAESVPISTTGHEKTGFTVVLAVREKAEANGHL